MKMSKALQALVREAAKDDAYWVERAKLDFATSLESQRRRAGLSYKEVADGIRSSPAYISKVFRGDSNLTIESMVKLARASGGCLEVRVVGQAELPSWTSSSLPNPTAGPALVAKPSDTVTRQCSVTSNVYWASHFFKRAA